MKRIHAHLSECRSCRARLESVRETAPLVAYLRDVAGPASETSFRDLIARIESRRQRGASRLGRASRLGGFTVVVAALAAVLLIASRTGKSRNGTEFAAANDPAQIEGRVLRNRKQLAAGEPEHGRRAPFKVAVVSSGSDTRLLRGVIGAQKSMIRLAAISHDPRKPGKSGRTRAARSVAAARPHADAADPALTAAANGMETRTPGSDEPQLQTDSQLQPVLLPAAEAGEGRVVSRAFVIGGIPTTTLTGQAGTVAAEAQNPESGKAL